MAIVMMAWVIAIPVLGGMTGLRTMTPMAILCWFAYRGHLDVHGTWAFWTAMLVTPIVFSVLAVGELIGDKLPQTPNRTDIFPAVGRVCFGGLVGAICATGLRGSAMEGALLAGFSAFLWTHIGFHVRHWLVVQLKWPGFWVAAAEDAIAVGLSVLAMGIVTG